MADPLKLDAATAETFEPFKGSEFQLALGDQQAPVATLVLSEIVPTKWLTPNGRTAFSLFFDGPSVPPLPQENYWLTHPAIGAMGLFLVPISDDSTTRRYQAAFN